MRRPNLVLIPLAAALAASSLQAAAQTIRGAGARPCSDWVQARTGNGHDYEAEQWALGYLSGVNASTRSQPAFRNTDEKTIFTGLDGYCGVHRQDMLWDAVKSVLATPHGA
jgi:hypothetical protein